MVQDEGRFETNAEQRAVSVGECSDDPIRDIYDDFGLVRSDFEVCYCCIPSRNLDVYCEIER
jgi:hypothetical protein